MSADGRRGYFASVRAGGLGFTDIFMVKYHGDKEHKPIIVLTTEQEQMLKEVEAEQLAHSNQFDERELSLMNHSHKIFFNTDQSAIKDEHQMELDSIIQLINKHDVLNIDIAGFASSDGNPRYNLDLSHKRALIVLDYFVSKGVSEERIIARGYGAVDEDSSPEEQRRADVRVVLSSTKRDSRKQEQNP